MGIPAPSLVRRSDRRPATRLGLIGLLINAFLLWLTAWLTHWWSWGLRVEDFWWGVVAAIIISLINWIFGIILRPKKD